MVITSFRYVQHNKYLGFYLVFVTGSRGLAITARRAGISPQQIYSPCLALNSANFTCLLCKRGFARRASHFRLQLSRRVR